VIARQARATDRPRANEFSRACRDSFLLIAAALLAFGASMTFESTDANAVVCARGVYRAGCAGPNAAVVVRKPVPAVRCTRVLVNGVYVKRCV